MRRNSPIWMGRTLSWGPLPRRLRLGFPAPYATRTSGTPAVTCSAAVSVRTMLHRRTVPLWFLFFLKKISCDNSKNWHSSGTSPVDHRTVRTSSTRNIRLLKPVLAKATTASRCSCLSRASPGALLGATLTWGRDACNALLRPTSCVALLASLYRPPSQAHRVATVRSATAVVLELDGKSAVVHSFLLCAEPAAAPPTKPFMALRTEPLAANGTLLKASPSSSLLQLPAVPRAAAPEVLVQ